MVANNRKQQWKEAWNKTNIIEIRPQGLSSPLDINLVSMVLQIERCVIAKALDKEEESNICREVGKEYVQDFRNPNKQVELSPDGKMVIDKYFRFTRLDPVTCTRPSYARKFYITTTTHREFAILISNGTLFSPGSARHWVARLR